MKYIDKAKNEFQRRVSAISEDISEIEEGYFSKCCACGKLAILFTMLGILSGIGGIIFMTTEYDEEKKRMERFIEINDTLYQHYIQNDHQIEVIQTWQAHRGLYRETHDREHLDGGNIWAFTYCFMFAFTTFTTIGFGLQAPSTVGGQLFTMLYGFPAMMAYFYLAECIGVIVLRNFDHFFLTKIYKNDEAKWQKHSVFYYSFSLISTYLFASFIIYFNATSEGFGTGINTYFDAMYFMWITISTIGFGDQMASVNPFNTLLIIIYIPMIVGIVFQIINYFNEKASEVVGPLTDSSLLPRSTTFHRATTFKNIVNKKITQKAVVSSIKKYKLKGHVITEEKEGVELVDKPVEI